LTDADLSAADLSGANLENAMMQANPNELIQAGRAVLRSS
jgi:uncharacterized protein YjbI with pentapeptide repeats